MHHYKDAKGILSAENGMNLYRGCQHGCIYCDSRSKCYRIETEHGFEDIEVKRNAPALLENALRRKRARCMIGTGAMCDPYMPLEATERMMRTCAEIIERHGFGLTVQTKSDLVLRDLDVFRRIQEKAKCVIQITLTTMDEKLCRIVEPKVCTTSRRAEVLDVFRKENIPTVVWLSPILPFLNDTEENLRGILDICFSAGVRGIICFNMGMTLRDGDREYYYSKLDEQFPGLTAQYIQAYGNSYVCDSPNAKRLMRIFHEECEKRGVLHHPGEVFTYLRAFEGKQYGEQLSLL